MQYATVARARVHTHTHTVCLCKLWGPLQCGCERERESKNV